MNGLPDAREQHIVRSWNTDARSWVKAIEPAAADAVAPASVIFVCKTHGAGQTARMEPYR
jgi:hypothetical protein